jgi:hypothetical protein
MKPIDNTFTKVFARANVNYTRFVDDITISATFRLRGYLPFMSRILKKFGLHLHPHKTEEFLPGDVPNVTGFACGKRLGLPISYISQIRSELEDSLAYSKGHGGAPPKYCRESYWGVIEYVRRVDSSASKALRRLFSNTRWSAFDSLGLPGKKGVLQRIGVNGH